jgi:hypothetical protein
MVETFDRSPAAIEPFDWTEKGVSPGHTGSPGETFGVMS